MMLKGTENFKLNRLLNSKVLNELDWFLLRLLEFLDLLLKFG